MFASREDTFTGTSLLHIHLQRFGMLMHVGSRETETSEGSNSKTEAVLFPCRTASIDEIQSNSTDFDLVCGSGGFITFINEFCYLGTIISSDLRDRPDIDRRINQASKAFGSLRSSVLCNEKQLTLTLLSDVIFSWQLSCTFFYGAVKPGHYCRRTITSLRCALISGLEP